MHGVLAYPGFPKAGRAAGGCRDAATRQAMAWPDMGAAAHRAVTLSVPPMTLSSRWPVRVPICSNDRPHPGEDDS